MTIEICEERPGDEASGFKAWRRRMVYFTLQEVESHGHELSRIWNIFAEGYIDEARMCLQRAERSVFYGIGSDHEYPHFRDDLYWFMCCVIDINIYLSLDLEYGAQHEEI